MKTLKSVTAAPEVIVEGGKPGTRQVKVSLGRYYDLPASESDPDFVHITISDPEIDGSLTAPALKGSVFLGVAVGTVGWDGERSFTELDGCIQPAQLDKLISCLVFARDEATTLGLLPSARTA
jgi:hypothetical protein